MKRPVTPLVPPTGAKAVGIDDLTGAIIYEMDELDIPAMEASKQIVRDPVTGQDVYRQGDHSFRYPVYRIPKPIWKRSRFILRDKGNYNVAKIRNFASEAVKAKEMEERKAAQDMVSDFATEAVRRGFRSAKDMLDALLGPHEMGEELAVVAGGADEILESRNE